MYKIKYIIINLIFNFLILYISLRDDMIYDPTFLEKPPNYRHLY